ncbi:hypothetical protein FA15DRAFT_706527 [Coprinopsis marcescibilis]|uniref:Uncharacterized protein n=1 Tax=Coprinopsis marcescibilis TaxID=230819 RepID=A0A5C3KP68_COPMA|nr:hypothetical protein FA15DRAFT_706527 [Coprinopsis marcescibilis]
MEMEEICNLLGTSDCNAYKFPAGYWRSLRILDSSGVPIEFPEDDDEEEMEAFDANDGSLQDTDTEAVEGYDPTSFGSLPEISDIEAAASSFTEGVECYDPTYFGRPPQISAIEAATSSFREVCNICTPPCPPRDPLPDDLDHCMCENFGYHMGSWALSIPQDELYKFYCDGKIPIGVYIAASSTEGERVEAQSSSWVSDMLLSMPSNGTPFHPFEESTLSIPSG